MSEERDMLGVLKTNRACLEVQRSNISQQNKVEVISKKNKVEVALLRTKRA
jgi:hypothetical protein